MSWSCLHQNKINIVFCWSGRSARADSSTQRSFGFLPFHPFPFPPVPSPSFSSFPFPPLPLIQLEGLGALGAPQRDPRSRAPTHTHFGGYFEARKRFWWQCVCSFSCDKIVVIGVKVGFHYPSSRAEFTGRVDGPRTRVHFLTPVNSGRELG